MGILVDIMSQKYSNGAIQNGGEASNGEELGVILGLDGGTTSTICVCIPFSDQLADPVRVLGRAVAGCSNHNSVGGICSFSSKPTIYVYLFVYADMMFVYLFNVCWDGFFLF